MTARQHYSKRMQNRSLFLKIGLDNEFKCYGRISPAINMLVARKITSRNNSLFWVHGCVRPKVCYQDVEYIPVGV